MPIGDFCRALFADHECPLSNRWPTTHWIRCQTAWEVYFTMPQTYQ